MYIYIYIFIQMIVRALFLVNPILLGLPLGLPHQQKGYPCLLHDLTKNTKRDVMEFQFCFGIIQNIAMSMQFLWTRLGSQISNPWKNMTGRSRVFQITATHIYPGFVTSTNFKAVFVFVQMLTSKCSILIEIMWPTTAKPLVSAQLIHTTESI